jgi:hypothetical protein
VTFQRFAASKISLSSRNARTFTTGGRDGPELPPRLTPIEAIPPSESGERRL